MKDSEQAVGAPGSPLLCETVPDRPQPALGLFGKGHVFFGNMGATNQKTGKKGGVQEGRK